MGIAWKWAGSPSRKEALKITGGGEKVSREDERLELLIIAWIGGGKKTEKVTRRARSTKESSFKTGCWSSEPRRKKRGDYN